MRGKDDVPWSDATIDNWCYIYGFAKVDAWKNARWARIQEIGDIEDEEEIEEWKQCFGFAKSEDPRSVETPDPRGAETSDKDGKCEEEGSEVSTDREERK